MLLEELLLGSYLYYEKTFRGFSSGAGISIQGEMPDNDTTYFDLTVQATDHANQTFPITLYDTSLNQIGDLRKSIDFEAFEPERYPGKPRIYFNPGTFLYDHFNLFEMEWHALMRISDNYLNESITLSDMNNDGNLNPGDAFTIELSPTDNEFSFNYYYFNLDGI